MQRRSFLRFSSLLGISSVLKAKPSEAFSKDFKEVAPIIAAVQEHMFPPGSQLPSAKEMRLTAFLFETIIHKTYDRDIRAFVIEGAKELQRREKRFVMLSSHEKEHILRAYEKESYGKNWLTRIMTLSLEGMFGDPIYGANIKEAGWKALHTSGGEPRPKSRYIEL